MDNFSTFSKEHINIKNSIKNINCAVVTGGAGRVGSVFTKILLSNKIKVFCLSRSLKNFNNFRKSLTKSEQSYLNFYKCDLANFKSIDEVIKKNKKIFKNIDLLVNNGSSSYRGEFFNYSRSNILNESKNMILGTIYLTEKLLPILRKKKLTRIINVGSIWGIVSPRGKTYLNLKIGPTAVLAASKAGIENYTKYLAAREAKNKIIVNNLVPGWFPRKGKVENKKYIKAINKHIPLNRIGRLEDLISPVYFLLSSGSNYYTGQNLVVDGGYTVY